MMNTPDILHNTPDKSPKVRASISLSTEVVDVIDQLVKTGKFDNRSQAIRRAVRIAFIEDGNGEQ
jgi:metal-responsive CopG/Arc/MetJ family transcriptional regulator